MVAVAYSSDVDIARNLKYTANTISFVCKRVITRLHKLARKSVYQRILQINNNLHTQNSKKKLCKSSEDYIWDPETSLEFRMDISNTAVPMVP